jgi:hypothetical protein
MFSFPVGVQDVFGAGAEKGTILPTDVEKGTIIKTDTSKLPNPLDIKTSIQTLIGKIINGALGLVGSIAFVMYIWGGFVWMTAGGEKEKVQKGADTLKWATIGLIIIFSSYAILNFVLDSIEKA